jgi:hypothetical protein
MGVKLVSSQKVREGQRFKNSVLTTISVPQGAPEICVNIYQVLFLHSSSTPTVTRILQCTYQCQQLQFRFALRWVQHKMAAPHMGEYGATTGYDGDRKTKHSAEGLT